MNASLHIVYITLTTAAFLLGGYFSPLSQTQQAVAPLATPAPNPIKKPVNTIARQNNKNHEGQSKGTEVLSTKLQDIPVVEEQEPSIFATQKCATEPTVLEDQSILAAVKPGIPKPLIHEQPKDPIYPESQETQVSTEQKEFQQQLSRLATKTGLLAAESEILTAEANGDIYRAIEQRLLTAPIENSERLDLINEYLIEHQDHSSPEFIIDVINSAYQMETGDQAYLLELIQQHSAETRDSKDEIYRQTLAASISPFKYSDDEDVRYATLLAINEAVDEQETREQELEYFLSDPSAVVRAQALVTLYQGN